MLVKIFFDNITPSVKGANISVTVSLRGGEAAFVAAYDSEGTLVDLVRLEPFVYNYSVEGDISLVKVIFWESEGSLVPINDVHSENKN